MTEPQKRGDESVVRYKKIVQVGVNSILDNEPQSVITVKVLCTTALLVDINKCCRCTHNDGLLNQYLMQCKNDQTQPLPDSLSAKTNIDYPEAKTDGKKEK